MSPATAAPATAATTVAQTSFDANWNAPAVGTVEKYFLDVSTAASFATSLAGYPKDVGNVTTYSVSGLNTGTVSHAVFSAVMLRGFREPSITAR